MAERIEGQVDYFNEVGSYGFITSDSDDAPDKDIFFSMEDVGGPDLEEGQVVQCEYKMAERGPRATDVEHDEDATSQKENGTAEQIEDDDDDGDSTDTAVYTGTDDSGDEGELTREEYRDLRTQLVDAFENAEFPIVNPMKPVSSLPEGVDTTFEAGGFSNTVIELGSKLDTDNFPYYDVETFVDDAFEQLESNGDVQLPDSIQFDDQDGGDDASDDTNVYDGRASDDAADAGGDDWDPVYRFCADCGTDLRKYGRITAGNFCPACGSLVGE